MALFRRDGFVLFKDFQIPGSCWERSHDRTKEISCLQLLSWNPTAEVVKYDLYCPIMYENVRNKRSRMYCQPILIKVCGSLPLFARAHTKTLTQVGRLILFGSTAISGTGKALAKNSSGMNWGALKTTAGFIAGVVGIVSASET